MFCIPLSTNHPSTTKHNRTFIIRTGLSLPAKSLALIGQQVFDVSTATEDSLQIHPSALDVNPHVKEVIDLVKSVVPSYGVVFKHLEVWGQLHSCHGVDVLFDLVEQVVPTSDDLALVLVVYQIQVVIVPCLSNLATQTAEWNIRYTDSDINSFLILKI